MAIMNTVTHIGSHTQKKNDYGIQSRNYRLFTVEGIVKRRDNADRLGDLSGMFAFVRPACVVLPEDLIGVTENENGDLLKVVIRNELSDTVKNAFFSDKPVLLSIRKADDYMPPIAEAAFPLGDEIVAGSRKQ